MYLLPSSINPTRKAGRLNPYPYQNSHDCYWEDEFDFRRDKENFTQTKLYYLRREIQTLAEEILSAKATGYSIHNSDMQTLLSDLDYLKDEFHRLQKRKHVYWDDEGYLDEEPVVVKKKKKQKPKTPEQLEAERIAKIAMEEEYRRIEAERIVRENKKQSVVAFLSVVKYRQQEMQKRYDKAAAWAAFQKENALPVTRRKIILETPEEVEQHQNLLVDVQQLAIGTFK